MRGLKAFALSIIGAAGGLLLYCGSFYAKCYLENRQVQKQYEAIKEDCFDEEERDRDMKTKNEEKQGETHEKKKKSPQPVQRKEIKESFGISWAKLRQINPDIVAWLTIPGADISYPVVQGKDNEHYLTHSVSGEKDPFGSIFLECDNKKNFMGSHSLVYGHNMEGNMMFANLNCYEKPEFLESCPEFYIITPKRKFFYEIFSIEQAEEDGVCFRYGYELESDEYREQLDILKAHSMYDTGIIPDASQRMVTLVTCNSRLDAEVRMTVHGICREIL